MAGLLSRERIVAGPGFNRWLVPPAALAIHLSIGMAYGFSVFWLPLSRAVGITEKLQDRLAARNRIGVTRGFAGCMRILGGSAVMGGFARSRFRGSCRSETVGQPGRRLGVFARGLAGACS